MTCKVIALEGADGLGKSTQIVRLAATLTKLDHSVNVVKMPRYTSVVGRLLRRMLQTGSSNAWPNVFQMLQWVDKIIFQLLVFPALLATKEYVLLDRWHASMWAYGLAGGASEKMTNVLVKTLREPTLTIVLTGTSKRLTKRDAYERDERLQESVELNYLTWFCSHSDNTCLVDADGTEEEVGDLILKHVYSASLKENTNEIKII